MPDPENGTTTFPSESSEPALRLINVRLREVWCPQCQLYLSSDQPNPKCKYCDSNLITVVYSGLTGLRITGSDIHIPWQCLIGLRK